MKREEALQVIRCLLIENENVIDREIIRVAFAHNNDTAFEQVIEID